MKLSAIIASLALAGYSAAQVTSLPQCAQSCVTQFTSGSSIGGCGSLDAKCICSNAGFLSGIACCLAGACSASDQAQAVAFAKSFCTTQGVTVPDAVVCNSSSASSGSAAATATSAASAATASTTSVAASASSVASSISSVIASIASSATSAAASAAATKNAGHREGAAGLSLVGGLAAAVALL